MSLWVDKYRPVSLDKLSYHEALTAQLKSLAASGDFPHLLVYGPSGAGKKTRIVAVLRELYGPGVEKLKIDVRNFATPSGRKLEINLIASNYHIEITPSDVGMYDRIVIQDLIKEVAQTQQVDSSAKRKFKVVIINEADTLTREAQAGLRRTMEKYMANLRVILCCNSTSKIIPPIRSRCLLVRVAAPSNDAVMSILQQVALKEGVDLPHSFANRIAEESGGNLRKALLMLETARVASYPFTERSEVLKTDWESFIQELAHSILQEQSPARLMAVRSKLYDLLAHCIPAEIVLKNLAFQLLHNVSEELKPGIAKAAAEYEHRIQLGNKPIFHLEAFVAKFMSIYKGYLLEIGA
ncbi:P-loop containing nucleoside triphosphate hydrolase protein [Polychytrium aggregatum]|uniref:P-loop containing nucleoside triphosphate hydrolase protein n=1 Tax=Polychytrium aggregatum TaxID=110093 RepID=UPI0022FDB25E|nr:P-loop containing nucleoside triphosphate hydrolase protein [Polychytrium aggregatum]KAI9207139.1 P-loop containing nucleoside triphosphate hydrolase protein [Polychytrium aggregatum]